MERLHETRPPHRSIIFCNRRPGWPELVLAGRNVKEERLPSIWSPGSHGNGVVLLFSRKTWRRTWVCTGGAHEVVVPSHTSGACKTPKPPAARGIHGMEAQKSRILPLTYHIPKDDVPGDKDDGMSLCSCNHGRYLLQAVKQHK